MKNKNCKHKIETLNFLELNYVHFYVDLFQLRASKIISLSIHVDGRDYTNCIHKFRFSSLNIILQFRHTFSLFWNSKCWRMVNVLAAIALSGYDLILVLLKSILFVYCEPSNIPTANNKFLRVKCKPMNGDDLVGKHRNRYCSPSRTSGLWETFTFSPVMSSHNLVKSHKRSVQSSEPVANIVPSRLKHSEWTVPVWPVNAAIKWP